MDRTERFYKIDQLLSERRVVPFSLLEEKLGVSRATIKRDLEYLRNRLNAPIIWDRDLGGYRFGEPERGGGKYELPGLWFNASEIHALLTMRHLLANLDAGGLLGPHIEPLLARLNGLLGGQTRDQDEINKRIRIIGIAARCMALEHFSAIGSALLRRRRVFIKYYVKARDEVTERELSPQRLVHYRENWYLDAWCHARGELRSFSLDAVREASVLEVAAQDVPEDTLDEILGAGYGIFSGLEVAWARLRFTRERARWVANERWHPLQRGRYEPDGSYILELPYSDHRELLMDVLRHGPEVEVLGPGPLRAQAIEALRGALNRYDPTEKEKD
ncbi:MAG TPA: WYL domain-containing protein [Rhodocyclaceae bacterium]